MWSIQCHLRAVSILLTGVAVYKVEQEDTFRGTSWQFSGQTPCSHCRPSSLPAQGSRSHTLQLKDPCAAARTWHNPNKYKWFSFLEEGTLESKSWLSWEQLVVYCPDWWTHQVSSCPTTAPGPASDANNSRPESSRNRCQQGIRPAGRTAVPLNTGEQWKENPSVNQLRPGFYYQKCVRVCRLVCMWNVS